MNAIQNFAFEEHLVRVVDRNGEPWFAGKDICHSLGIRDHHQALETLDPDERGGCEIPTPQGAQSMIVVSEPGVYRLVFRSRKPEAERFKRWLAHDVLPKIRKTGSYARNHSPPEPLPTLDNSSVPLWRTKIDLVREARIQFGPARARLLWAELGLPPVPDLPQIAPMAGDLDGQAVLARILAHQINGSPVEHLVASAAENDQEARITLDRFGLHLGVGGVFIANAAPAIDALFPGVSWVAALRRIPDAAPADRRSFAGRQMRTTWVPLDY